MRESKRTKIGGATSTLPKAATGIRGLDDITGGGLPLGRPTLVCGTAGCGKTMFALEFLVHGATEFGEPGVFMSFEERTEELAQNAASLGFDLKALERRRKISLDYVRVERAEIEETGEYDLEGLFIRLGHAIDAIGAKRVALDTIESLFAGLSNAAVLRSELRRLFGWLKDKGVTAVITAERGDGQLTRQGLEEYVSDCVILLDHPVIEQISTRRLRIVKYRGSSHGTDEYPFLIDRDGLSVLPITSIGLAHPTSDERVSTGIERLDAMLGGRGYYRGSSILVSGTAGTGKTSIAAHFTQAVCRRGERCLYFAFEESPKQIMRNMRSIGIDLGRWEDGLLRFHAARPTAFGLETHLALMHRLITDFAPSAVVMDPITNLMAAGSESEVARMLLRLLDFLKSLQITSVFTSLTHSESLETSDVGVSSLMDTWLLLRNLEENGERNRGLYVLKSRGMAHSNQIREFTLTDEGVVLRDVYVGLDGVLTGTARLAQEAREREEEIVRRREAARRRTLLERKRRALEAQIAALRATFDAEEEDDRALDSDLGAEATRSEADRRAMMSSRFGDEEAPGPNGGGNSRGRRR
ncbi:MAG TPA: circadian clock protein KaiC [Candidatus Binatia bacterium]|nr:circadian clock protein KaiC [Candidatus Binatia bacterium]